MPPWGRSLEYRLELVIKQFNHSTSTYKSIQIHKMCLGTCPTILPSLCTATVNTSILFPHSLVQVKVSPGVAFQMAGLLDPNVTIKNKHP